VNRRNMDFQPDHETAAADLLSDIFPPTLSIRKSQADYGAGRRWEMNHERLVAFVEVLDRGLMTSGSSPTAADSAGHGGVTL